MSRAVVFDISRLATRFSRLTPNGIDRVDLAFARQFTGTNSSGSSLLLTPLGPRAVPTTTAGHLVAAIDAHWREEGPAEGDLAFVELKQRLRGEPAPGVQRAVAPHALSSLRRLFREAPWFGANGLLGGTSPVVGVPKDAIYLNVSQFPLWVPAYFSWLRRRPDVRPVFMIHDLLPVRYPEFFPPPEFERHVRRLRVLARIAAAAIVTTETTKTHLQEHLHKLGASLPILAEPLPVASTFHAPTTLDPVLAATPYFLVCGTVEPRKNHLLLLNVWRELARALGPATPKLIIAGSRGWEYENIADMLDRSQHLRPHVIEAPHLSTPALKCLLAHTRALLMPSFAEGFGLPVAEALAVGAPVIVSDIQAFAGLRSKLVTRLDPVDGLGWQVAIHSHLERPMREILASPPGVEARSVNEELYFRHVTKFLHILP